MQAVVDVEKPVEAIATTEDCRYCWMCRHACPVGHVTQRETLTPHGWALTIASVRRGTLRWNDETVDALYACADCGLCRAHCITDRPLPDAIAAARAEVVAAGLAPAVVYRLKEELERRGIPNGARGEGDTLAREGNARARGDVGLFMGDAAPQFGGREIDGVRRLLSAIGIEPVLVGDGRSTGLVASSLGLRDTAALLARATLDEIESVGCRELLVLTPGDRFAFERVYRDRLQVAWPAQVAIKDVTSVLADALAAGRLAFRRRADAATYAYHDPCHSARIDRDDAGPRVLLAAALGEASARHLFWRERRAHPCGATGGLEVTQPAIAAKLADARLADARAAGAAWLITDDPACAQHLRRRAQQHASQQDVEVIGFYELLADQLASQPGSATELGARSDAVG
jgi:Fe-S oxidoreductase